MPGSLGPQSRQDPIARPTRPGPLAQAAARPANPAACGGAGGARERAWRDHAGSWHQAGDNSGSGWAGRQVGRRASRPSPAAAPARGRLGAARPRRRHTPRQARPALALLCCQGGGEGTPAPAAAPGRRWPCWLHHVDGGAGGGWEAWQRGMTGPKMPARASMAPLTRQCTRRCAHTNPPALGVALRADSSEKRGPGSAGNRARSSSKKWRSGSSAGARGVRAGQGR